MNNNPFNKTNDDSTSSLRAHIIDNKLESASIMEHKHTDAPELVAMEAAYTVDDGLSEPISPSWTSLSSLGWDESWSEVWTTWLAELNEAAMRRFGDSLVPARVALAHKHLYRVYGEAGEWLAEPSGQARAAMLMPSDWPAVGDWVAVAPRPAEGRATIAGVLPRRGVFARKVAGGRKDAQVIASNVDIALLVTAMTVDFEPRRLERYAALAYDSGALPLVVLTKADAVADPTQAADYVAQAMNAVPGAQVYTVSSLTNEGIEELRAALPSGSTVVLVGSSGVGKSTLSNALSGTQHMLTQDIREGDGKGRHTTTHRELLPLSHGAWLIDTPGMREVGLVTLEGNDGHGLSDAFEDVEGFAAECRFTDCEHQREPGCAVQQALASGELEAARLTAYRKLQREFAFMKRSEDARALREYKSTNKQSARNYKAAMRQKKR
ncbi:ribosome small subunit-dependent GTPase A [Paenibacillus sp. ACRRX]|uniref:ribosome small subunit-dependent GTPase A n=1 Tax=Paenibacillus sp. ACRRX TaxID=2918206 RepID=UPI001EF6B2DE|nr:ribosome small subunit-dependent GTPase A [Paenibacillus sp. ACRRX]MCG7409048.1 ribosome small subunit-dependent GTPase A [Paenibacillus sp. ACRRX]